MILPNIEVGGGTIFVPPGCFNLDCRHGVGQWKRNAQDTPWPTPDASIGNVRASHVMEHIPAGQDRIDVMNEAWRVLIPNGTFEILVPLLIGNPGGFPSILTQAVADPTHVSFWCIESFSYFDGTAQLDADYGIKLWHTETMELRQEFEGRWVGTPVKD